METKHLNKLIRLTATMFFFLFVAGAVLERGTVWANGQQEWAISHLLDGFGDKTDQSFMGVVVEGTFCNSASTNSFLSTEPYISSCGNMARTQ